MVKLCINCEHLGHGWKGHGSCRPFKLCRRPLGEEMSLVDGSFLHRLNEWPADERRPGKTLLGRRQRCGPEGRYFETREEPNG